MADKSTVCNASQRIEISHCIGCFLHCANQSQRVMARQKSINDNELIVNFEAEI